MLAIRLQRTGRKGHAEYRMIVQDSRLSPTSGKVVASLGSYNPHGKNLTVNKEKASFYLQNGAQPSPRVVRLLTEDGLKMPEWVKQAAKKESVIKNAEKLRRNRPVEEAPAVEAEAPAEEPTEATEEVAVAEETPAAEPVESAPEEAPTEEKA